jgi:uncharacterized protein YceK
MRIVSVHALAVLATMAAALQACSTVQHANVAHPGYGHAQYRADLADCRRQNSKVESIQGYDVQNRIIVDEAKADACMTGRGWRTVSR